MEKFFKRPALILAAIGVITAFFAFQLRRAELDNNNIRFIPENDEARITSKYIEDTFGSSSFILVALEKKDGMVFDPAFLAKIKSYVERIEAIDIIGDVNSIMTADYITADGDSIVVKKLVEDDFSGTPAEIDALKERLLSWELYRTSLVSDDWTSTQILVPLEIDSEDTGKSEIVAEYMQVRDIAHTLFDNDANVYVTGLPVISATISESMKTDLVILIPLVVIVVLLTLLMSFRRGTPVLLTLLTVLVATLWAMGAMPLFGIKLTILSTVLPVILVAVGSAYGIHIITHYIDEMKQRENITDDEHSALIFSVLRKIRRPVFFAALTTFAGFVSFCFTSVLPIREWGIFASFGVIASFIVAITMIPSLLIIRGPKPIGKRSLPRRQPKGDSSPVDDRNLLTMILVSIVRKKRFILGLTVIAVLISVYGASKVIIDNIFIAYFNPATGIVASDRFIREKFGGSKIVDVVMQADTSEALLHPDALSAMDGLKTYLVDNVSETGKVMGFTDLVKRINQVFNAEESPEGLQASTRSKSGDNTDEDFGFGFGDADDTKELTTRSEIGNDTNGGAEIRDNALAKTYSGEELMALFSQSLVNGGGYRMSAADMVAALNRLTNYNGASYYEIPSDPARYGKTTPEELQRVVSNYLALLSGSISSYANDPLEPTAIKSTIQLRTIGELDTGAVLTSMRGYIDTHFPKTVKTLVGGTALIEASLNRLIVHSQLTSLVISMLIVFIILSVSNRSILGGVIGIVPLAISILLNFAVMGFVGIKLNIGTSLVASLAVGIGIDYTIHFMEAYKAEYRASGGQGDFLRRTFSTAGMAIIINALSVGVGFAVLMLSQFVILRDLGLLICLTMIMSALVSLTVIPVLLSIIKPQFISKE
ncbi:MAG: MMPL family transporter [Treponema sp.]|nr:MMPL family transporter [Treponema sp.]